MKANINDDEVTFDATIHACLPLPGDGKVAVELINDYSDEVVKVYER
jgi:hypothetical protein